MPKVVAEKQGKVGLIRLNRPEVLNALDSGTMAELIAAFEAFDADGEVGCIVVTGCERAFAAGADIEEMCSIGHAEAMHGDFFRYHWRSLREFSKPIIAAVSGYALGGGCELAMCCDMIFAADNAFFGQPEIKIGTLPGIGGTQRLPRAIGKAKAMDMCLTGRLMDAREAEQSGLVARVYPVARLLEETLAAAKIIAAQSQPVVAMIKESINSAYETSLSEGLAFERQHFQSSFALEDRAEGMRAFVEKRPPQFKHR